MVFSSLLFVLKFLPIALFLMWITPKKYRNGMLLVLSLVFYTWGEVRYVFIMFLSIVLDYTCSNGIEHHRDDPRKTKLYLMVSIIGNLGMLFFFKYTDFAISIFNGAFKTSIPLLNLTLPLGISFYTFQTMSYTIDVYRGHLKADRNLIDFGAFVCLFPQLIAGPIVTYGQIAKELKHRNITLDMFTEGVRIFILGLACKLLLANNIGLLWDDVALLGPSRISSPLAWLGLIAFGFQIYFDFSGYSLMAIGMGKMLGFEFPDNFNYPYISRSMTEFWKRWHMTLGSWFREYVYIPLGGNRKGFKRQILNLLIVWFLTGLWHGASVNFILWGLYFFVLLALEKWFLLSWLDQHPIFSHLYFIVGILIGWAIFAMTDLSVMSAYLSRLLSFKIGTDVLYYLRNYGFILTACLLFSTPLIAKLKAFRFVMPVFKLAAGVLFVVSIAYLVDSSYNPFLYFRF